MIVLGIIGKIMLVLLKILLILLLVLLILLLVVLLLPASYEATGRADGETGLAGTDVRAAAKYGFGLLAFRFHFTGGDMAYSLKLAGKKTLMKGGRKRQEPEEEPEPEDFPEAEPETADRPSAAEMAAPDLPEPAEEAVRAPGAAEQQTAQPEKPRKEPKKKKEKPPQPKEDVPDREKEPLTDRLDRLQEKREALWDKLLGLWDQLQDPANRKTASRVLKAVGRLLRRVLPRVVKGKVLFGTGDPALTGQILGAFYALYPLYGEKWELTVSGDFEEKKIKGKAYLAGRFRLMGILTPFLGLLADRNIRKLILKWWKNR